VKGVINDESRGWAMARSGEFQSDRAADPPLGRDALESLLAGTDQTLTFMCAPWGSGIRIGIDRDLDGVLDGDE
jgi:hypothetical protein